MTGSLVVQLFELNIKNEMREMAFAFEAGFNSIPYQSIQRESSQANISWLCVELKTEVL